MSLPVVFATLAAGNQPLSLLDTNFNAVAALGAVPCAASGQNAIALTPFSNSPTIASYPDLQPSFVFVAAQTSNAAVTANVSLVGARNVYKWGGAVQCGAGDIVTGQVYRLTPLLALNAGAGGFVCDAIGVGNNLTVLDFIIDGGGSAITTGVKGTIGPLPWGATIQSWTLDADQNGSITIDIFRANNAHPTVSIVGGGGTKPTLSSAQFNGLQAPSGWTSTVLVPNDLLAFSVSTVATVTRVTLGLILVKI
jgi:hypothetical protein